VRQCATCGAERGNKLERKLRARVTPRSGGADDVGGVAIRLAANSWLRDRRQSQWSVACLDEPFAALDQHNRHAVARHLAALLGGRYGVEQAFITAHDPALLAGLPRRIVVRGGERGSTVVVIG
jgi:DNA repair exonuclease SbcCD ATPase subunit